MHRLRMQPPHTPPSPSPFTPSSLPSFPLFTSLALPPSRRTPLHPPDMSSTSSFCLNKILRRFTQAQSNKTEGLWLKLAKWPCSLCLCRNVGRDQLDLEMAAFLLSLSIHLSLSLSPSSLNIKGISHINDTS